MPQLQLEVRRAILQTLKDPKVQAHIRKVVRKAHATKTRSRKRRHRRSRR